MCIQGPSCDYGDLVTRPAAVRDKNTSAGTVDTFIKFFNIQEKGEKIRQCNDIQLSIQNGRAKFYRLLRSMSSWERTVSHTDKYHCFGKSSFWRTYVLKLLRSARFIRLDESESSAANEELTACHTSNSQGWDAMGKYQQQTIMKIRHTI